MNNATEISPRRAYLDNLKAFLVAGVITGHVFITYADVGSWAYREPSANRAFIIPAALYVAVGSMFAMGLFFLIAGLLLPRALARKGPAGFLRDRLVRLGPPLLAFLLVIFPIVRWLGDRRGRSLAWFFRDQLTELDPGPLWFVLALLIFSAAYAAWRAVRPARPAPRPWRPSFLPFLAAGIAAATFVVRLRYPIDSHQIFVLHVWQWPQCVGLFALGIACARNGWLDPVNRVGDSGPLGARPAYRRLGLTRAVLLACLRPMQKRGMKRVSVSTPSISAVSISPMRTVETPPMNSRLSIEIRSSCPCTSGRASTAGSWRMGPNP